jgi:peroxiredoxin
MVTQGNIAPDFTLEMDRSEKVTLSKLRGRQVVLLLPEGRHTWMEDRVQGQMMKAAAAWAREGSWC